MNKKRSRVNLDDKHLIWSKLLKYFTEGYPLIENGGSLKNMIDYIAVQKGENDIRVAYNEAKCGLNPATECSNLWLPTYTTLTCLLSYDYKVVDMDIVEIFPNFPIYESLKM